MPPFCLICNLYYRSSDIENSTFAGDDIATPPMLTPSKISLRIATLSPSRSNTLPCSTANLKINPDLLVLVQDRLV